MILSAATISGFKSFRKPVQIFFSGRTTVLIGPNDHGKTNVLMAIDKLGTDKAFAQDEINDRVRQETTAHITYQFQVTETEIQTIETLIAPLLEQESKSERESLSTLLAPAEAESTETPRVVG